MATIRRFQELEVWKLSKEMAVIAFKTFDSVKEINARLLISQLIRSVVSVPSNIAEGFEREGRKEFINFLSIAKGSNGEFLTQLMIAKEVGIVGENEFNKLSTLSYQTGLMLRKLMQYLTGSNYKGQKFKFSVKEPISAMKQTTLTPG
jgi:four helix bundle protein